MWKTWSASVMSIQDGKLHLKTALDRRMSFRRDFFCVASAQSLEKLALSSFECLRVRGPCLPPSPPCGSSSSLPSAALREAPPDALLRTAE